MPPGNGPDGPGHTWYLYRARTAGHLQVDPDSYRAMWWADPAELRTLAARTVGYARGNLSDTEWAQAPGIEPVWVLWLHKADPDALPLGSKNLDDVEETLPDCLPTQAIDLTSAADDTGRAS